MSQIDELLQQCTVKITLSTESGWGTGFFVAPGLILTCAHVMKALNLGASAQISWQQQKGFAEAVVIEHSFEYDLALLQFSPLQNTNLPCVYLDSEFQPTDNFYTYGYPDTFPDGASVTSQCEGNAYEKGVPLILFKAGLIRPGFSGSPLLNLRTRKVCGIVKFTRDRSIDLGGGAIPTKVILEKFPALREQQQSFHQSDQRWWQQIQVLNESLPPGIKQIEELEKLSKYFNHATRLIIQIKKSEKDSPQASQIYRDALEERRLKLQHLQEKAFDIENKIFQLFKKLEVDIKAKMEKYKNYINDKEISKFTGEIIQALSNYQDSIGLGKEAVDQSKRVRDKIISIIYVEIADDLICQEQLSKAKIFLEEAARLDKNNPLAPQNLAFIWFKKEKYTKALVELKKAKKLLIEEGMSEDEKKIDLIINRIPISSRIVHLIGTVLYQFKEDLRQIGHLR